jgi:hypothetical protein
VNTAEESARLHPDALASSRGTQPRSPVRRHGHRELKGAGRSQDGPNTREKASPRIAHGSRSLRRLTEGIGNVESGDQRRPECERQHPPERRVCGVQSGQSGLRPLDNGSRCRWNIHRVRARPRSRRCTVR